MICEKCEDKYLLKNGVCVFQGCQTNLYNQVEQSYDNNSIGNCLSISNPLFYVDESTNICKQQVQCSSIYSTQPNILNNGIPLDFFIYQQSYYVAIQQGYLSIYNRSTLNLVKHLSYQQDDFAIQSISGIIIVIKQDFSINIWDILIERRYYVQKSNLISIMQKSQFIQLLTSYLLIYEVQKQFSSFQIIYDLVKQEQMNSNVFQINQAISYVIGLNDLIFLGDVKNLNVYQIYYPQLNNNLNITLITTINFPNQGNVLQVLQTPNSSLYIIVFIDSILEIDLNKSKFSPLIKLSQIQKIKILAPLNDQNDLHLIILSDINLIDYNYQTNLQNIISNETMIVTDFDVGNFSGIGNQLIVLYNSTKLQVYNFINSQNQCQLQQSFESIYFGKSLQKIQINYSQQSAESLTNFEIFWISSTQIQIIKESLIQKYVLEVNSIENFNISFPTPSSQINSLILNYSLPILTSCHENGDIIFYDASRSQSSSLVEQIIIFIY